MSGIPIGIIGCGNISKVYAGAGRKFENHVLDLMHSIVDASETGRHVEMRSAMSRPEPLPQGLPAGKVE